MSCFCMQVKGLSLKPRQYHSATALVINQDVTEVTMFGGLNGTNDILSDTTVLKFGEY